MSESIVRRVKGGSVWMIALAMTLGMAGCEQSSELPPAPQLAPGEGFNAKISEFSTEKMIDLCRKTNITAEEGGFRESTDTVIANATCAIPLFTVEIISRHADQSAISECLSASQAVVGEFKRRFPSHDPKEVVGRC